MPRFVLDQILHFRKIDPSIDIDVLVPQHAYSKVLPKYRVLTPIEKFDTTISGLGVLRS